MDEVTTEQETASAIEPSKQAQADFDFACSVIAERAGESLTDADIEKLAAQIVAKSLPIGNKAREREIRRRIVEHPYLSQFKRQRTKRGKTVSIDAPRLKGREARGDAELNPETFADLSYVIELADPKSGLFDSSLEQIVESLLPELSEKNRDILTRLLKWDGFLDSPSLRDMACAINAHPEQVRRALQDFRKAMRKDRKLRCHHPPNFHGPHVISGRFFWAVLEDDSESKFVQVQRMAAERGPQLPELRPVKRVRRYRYPFKDPNG